MTTIHLEGSKELQAAFRRLSADVRQAVEKEVVATAVELRTDVVKSLKKPGRGVTYYLSNPTRTHTASAPGDAPATDTGRLSNGIYFERLGELTAAVGTRVEYGNHLEYGTFRMAARPFMRPAVERMRPKYVGRLEKIMGRMLRK